MRLGILQLSISCDPNEHRSTVLGLLRTHAPGHGLVLLPEVFHSNYADLPFGALNYGDGWLRDLEGLSAEMPGVTLAGTLALRTSMGVANTLCLFREGRMETIYEKTHLFRPMGEDRLFCAGDRLGLAEVEGEAGRIWQVGFATCYDLRYPELFRALADRGAELVAVPAQWPAVRSEVWSALLVARAAENQIYVAGANRCGSSPSEEFGGRSMVVGPLGNVLAEAGAEPEFLSLHLAPGAICEARTFNDQLALRRSDLYRMDWIGR